MMYSYCETCESFGNNTGVVLLFVYTKHTETLKDQRATLKRHKERRNIHGSLKRGGTGAVDCSKTLDGQSIIFMYTTY